MEMSRYGIWRIGGLSRFSLVLCGFAFEDLFEGRIGFCSAVIYKDMLCNMCIAWESTKK